MRRNRPPLTPETLSAMSTRTILVSLLVLSVTGCAGRHDAASSNAPTGALRVFWACESLRASDPTIVRQAIATLFRVRGLEAYMLLHLKWIAEPNPEVRKDILAGFANIGDHRGIADPDFPQEWVKAAERFPTQEREARLRELREHFPEEMRGIGR